MVDINEIIGTGQDGAWSSMETIDQRVYVRTPDARKVLARGIKYFVGEGAVWLPEYEAVTEWLSDNKGRGLLCAGQCGRGKTVICQKVLPVIFRHWHRLIVNTVTATELNDRYDEFRQYKIISIDDVGKESVANRYGEKHNYIEEIVDEAERKQKLLIISTNLNEDGLKQRYDDRTIDRLRAVTRPVLFIGDSLRK